VRHVRRRPPPLPRHKGGLGERAGTCDYTHITVRVYKQLALCFGRDRIRDGGSWGTGRRGFRGAGPAGPETVEREVAPEDRGFRLCLKRVWDPCRRPRAS